MTMTQSIGGLFTNDMTVTASGRTFHSWSYSEWWGSDQGRPLEWTMTPARAA